MEKCWDFLLSGDSSKQMCSWVTIPYLLQKEHDHLEAINTLRLVTDRYPLLFDSKTIFSVIPKPLFWYSGFQNNLWAIKEMASFTFK